MTLPVHLGGQRQLALRVGKGENVSRTVEAFADVHALDETMALRIRHAVIAGMNPGAYVVPLQV